MAKITKKTFIEIDFTGKIKENGAVFDTTVKKVALDNNLNPNANYEPAVICVGEGYIFKKLEDSLIGKGIGNKVKVELSAEEGFGKKDSKKIHLLPASVFLKQKIKPVIGLQVNVNNMMGVIRTVTGGRCMVDFNHPLAGRDLVFDVRITKLLKDPKEKAQSLFQSLLMLDPSKYSIEIEGDKLKIKSKFEIPDMMLNIAKDKIMKLVPEINSIEVSTNKKEATTSE